VPVGVELDAGALGDGEDVVGVDGHLGGVAGGLTPVLQVARVGRRAAGDVPLVGPVAVEVGAYAGGPDAGLPVLAPEAILGVAEDEAWEVF
jgi:hypothetical protein